MENGIYNKERKLIEEYDELKPKLISWANIVDFALLDLLNDIGIKPQIPPKFRLKTNESVIRNAFYRRIETSSKPLLRIKDKIGTRIVVTTIDDAIIIKNAILKYSKWKVRVSRDYDKKFQNPKEFDYISIHLELTPKQDTSSFEKMSKKKLGYYTCEVQIRTLLQHAFAEVAHNTVYKGPYSSASELVRTLSQSMALMEVTDEYFSKAFRIMKKDSTYETSFLNRLISFSKEQLDVEFSKKEYDNDLTIEVFSMFDVKKYEIERLERTLINKKSIAVKSINKVQSYLKSQPVLIFLMYLVLTDRYTVKDNWELEESIIEELFYLLGYSYSR